jgi:hypothetical protein
MQRAADKPRRVLAFRRDKEHASPCKPRQKGGYNVCINPDLRGGDRCCGGCRRSENEYFLVLEKSDGFISYTLVKAGHDSVVSISFFETYDQAAEANQAIRELVRGELNHLMPHPPKAIVGEVIGHLEK